MALDLVPFRHEFFEEYSSWFRDPELNRHLGPMNREWLDCVLSEPEASGVTWAAFSDSVLVGVVETAFDPDNRLPAAITAVAVKPSLRRQGFGADIIREVLSRDHDKGQHDHIAYISPDNPAAQRLLTKLGFTPSSVAPAPSGYIEFRHRGKPTTSAEPCNVR
ncbi:MAG TPA: GNAT family N-acetyltransferase [Verrucomicrobiae bacterium]|nr:GNAT family N-acetyltransferase [Verrucomicrobiae bacterium]